MGNNWAMAWKETNVTDERMKFLGDWRMGGWSMTDLCMAYGVSRKTGYKLVNRYLEEGIDGLKDRSRSPHAHPNATQPDIVREVIAVRKKYGWGGRKIVDYLGRRMSRAVLPAPSTVDEILRRHGLVKPKRRRTKRSDIKAVRHIRGPNDGWCADFKGWFHTRDGARCDPLTMTDSHSRYLLRCTHVSSTSFEANKPQFVRAFRDFGLPRSIRTDNGPPFATIGIGGLSRLSIWFIRLGIQPDLIDPGKPQQNGAHERMHRTLKQETARPPKASLRAQQRAFHAFRRMYNDERPHEGIDGKVPSDLYTWSERAYPARLPELVYPDSFLVRRVSHVGGIKLEGQKIFLGRSLRGECVGLEPVSDLHLAVHFGPYQIATVDRTKNEVLMFRKPRRPN